MTGLPVISGVVPVIQAHKPLLQSLQVCCMVLRLLRFQWLTSSLLQVRLGTVEPLATTTLAAIRNLQPYTISWSNVPDYIAPAEFHKMARAVSANEDTVHFMHSMNWVKDVMGAFHIDIMLRMPEQSLPKVGQSLTVGLSAAVHACS